MPEPRPNQPNPLLLVSVSNAEEAAIAAAAGVDLVDAKDPFRGALGALSPAKVRDIVTASTLPSRTSAVAGEAEDDGAVIAEIAAIAGTGVDFVKVAIRHDAAESLLVRAATAARGRLIGVGFAEDDVGSNFPARLAAAGFIGAMIDTRGKSGRRLTDILGFDALAGFVGACRAEGLLCGLAGSLRIADIPGLSALAPDYLGFRGGLCRGGDRRNPLDPLRIAQAIRELRAPGHANAA